MGIWWRRLSALVKVERCFGGGTDKYTGHIGCNGTEAVHAVGMIFIDACVSGNKIPYPGLDPLLRTLSEWAD